MPKIVYCKFCQLDYHLILFSTKICTGWRFPNWPPGIFINWGWFLSFHALRVCCLSAYPIQRSCFELYEMTRIKISLFETWCKSSFLTCGINQPIPVIGNNNLIRIFIWVLSLNKMAKALALIHFIRLWNLWYLFLSIFSLHGSFYSRLGPEQSSHWSEISKKMLIVRDMRLSKSCHSHSLNR